MGEGIASGRSLAKLSPRKRAARLVRTQGSQPGRRNRTETSGRGEAAVSGYRGAGGGGGGGGGKGRERGETPGARPPALSTRESSAAAPRMPRPRRRGYNRGAGRDRRQPLGAVEPERRRRRRRRSGSPPAEEAAHRCRLRGLGESSRGPAVLPSMGWGSPASAVPARPPPA